MWGARATARIRRATETDTAAIATLHGACFPDQPWGPDTIGRLLREPVGFALLACEPCEAVGFCIGRTAAGECEILSLGVLPGRRLRGTGRQLLREALKEACRRRCFEAFLEVAEDNEAALGLYRNLGFDRVGRRQAYYRPAGRPAVDALVLRRPKPSQ